MPVDAVLVDRAARRIAVRARALPGATLGAYRTLERRVADVSPGWTIALTPPPAPPGTVTFADDTVTPAGQVIIADAIWGADRLGLPLVVTGPRARAQRVAAALAAAGAATDMAAARNGEVSLRWAAPPAP